MEAKDFKNNTNVEHLGESEDIILENKFCFVLFCVLKETMSLKKNALTFLGGEIPDF